MCVLHTAEAQNDVNNIQLPELHRDIQRKTIRVPSIEKYITLKCDFHMHTVFSDGIVWPTTRVLEAWEEGLDAIAITDHIESHPSKPFISGDDNSSYQLALPAAQDYNIILIKGAEITRAMPPGHLNALFITDANKLDIPDPIEAIREAHRQGAFVFWNHPGWTAQQPDTCRMFDIHRQLIEEGIIKGIEVFNEMEWYPVVLGWCIDKNLAVIGNSDVHDINDHYYPLHLYHRPMTLVFASERTEAGVKEALLSQRSVAWFSKYVTGKQDLLNALFQGAVNVSRANGKDSRGNSMITLTNNSDFIFECQSATPGTPSFTLQPNATFIIRYKEDIHPLSALSLSITNWYTHASQCLKVSLSL
ncbi:MAG: hypothetical protein JXA72_09040 [Bacteroidales bacterium]|nr:hypothetical protein [Bacteroidales bacterium]